MDAPLAQPRPLVAGHFIGALTGICITKLFLLLPPERFTELQWLSSSLCVAVALVLMQITNTVHPPAGATAILPALNEEIMNLSWYYLPIVLLTSALALVVALFTNNIQRRYPVFWFTPAKPVSPMSKNEINVTLRELGMPMMSVSEVDLESNYRYPTRAGKGVLDDASVAPSRSRVDVIWDLTRENTREDAGETRPLVAYGRQARRY